MTKELQDLAWSILPKEFKEEVKKLYCTPGLRAEVYTLLQNLFGAGNLTSDAEGEEILTVSRKQVIELYTALQNEHKRKDVELYNRISAEDRAAMLYDFFGSKCLPDEAPKPAEPKEEVAKMKSIDSKVSVYLATKEEDEEFRQLLHENGFRWNGGNILIDSPCWDSDIQESKIHFVYPDKTVTYSGKRTEDTLTFTEFKKQYFGEEASPNVNNSDIDIDELVAKGYVLDPAKQFDNILKDGFRDHNRLQIAAMAMQGLLSNKTRFSSYEISDLVRISLNCADALIAEAEKGGRDV